MGERAIRRTARFGDREGGAASGRGEEVVRTCGLARRAGSVGGARRASSSDLVLGDTGTASCALLGAARPGRGAVRGPAGAGGRGGGRGGGGSAVLAGGRWAIVLVPEVVPVPATVAGDRGGVRGAGRVARRRGQAGAVPDVARDRGRAVRRGGGDAAGGVRAGAERRGDRRRRARAIRRIARIGRRTTTFGTSRWSERARRGGVRALRGVSVARRPSALGVAEVAPSTGDGRRSRSCARARGACAATGRALRETHRGFLYEPLPGYGMAQVCRSCGGPAACAACGGTLRSEEGIVRCIVCEAPGRCADCGAVDFGVRRGGAERVEEWASTVAPVPVRRVATRGRARLPRRRRSSSAARSPCGTSGPATSSSSPILDADLAERRAGTRLAGTRVGDVDGGGRMGSAVGQGDRPDRPARTTRPSRRWCAATRIGSTRTRRARRAAAGFPVGCAVFRVAGSDALEAELAGVDPHHVARLVRRRADGMLARARAAVVWRRSVARSATRGARHREAGRGGTAPVRVRTVEQST